MRSDSVDVRITTIDRVAAALLLSVTLACDSSIAPDATPKAPEAPEAPVPRIMPGQIVFVDRKSSLIFVADSNGATVTRLSAGSSDFDRDPAVSADGKKIAFSSRQGREDGTGIWVMDADGANQIRLTPTVNASGHRINESPAWSPDGRRIAYVTSQGLWDHKVFVMNADGSDIKQLTDDDMDSIAPEWSPDGSKILFSRPAGSPAHAGIFEMNPDGSNVHQLLSGCCVRTATRSPDRKQIAFIKNNTLFVMNANGSNPRALRDIYWEFVDLAWAPDGESIVFGVPSTPIMCWDWEATYEYLCGYDEDLRRISLDGVIIPNWKLSSASNPVWQR